MRIIGSNIGGESSGNILFKNFSTTGDGLLAAIKLLMILKNSGKKLTELKRQIILFPQISKSYKVKEKIPIENLPDLNNALNHAESILGKKGRILLRYSGTEEKIRLLVESESKEQAEKIFLKVEAVVKKSLVVF